MTCVWTGGHSNRSWEEFLELLVRNRISVLTDVRAFPGSRKHPQFGKDRLPGLLEDAGIEYVHEPRLGGRRRLERDIGIAERGATAPSVRTRTREFQDAIDELEQRAVHERSRSAAPRRSGGDATAAGFARIGNGDVSWPETSCAAATRHVRT